MAISCAWSVINYSPDTRFLKCISEEHMKLVEVLALAWSSASNCSFRILRKITKITYLNNHFRLSPCSNPSWSYYTKPIKCYLSSWFISMEELILKNNKWNYLVRIALRDPIQISLLLTRIPVMVRLRLDYVIPSYLCDQSYPSKQRQLIEPTIKNIYRQSKKWTYINLYFLNHKKDFWKHSGLTKKRTTNEWKKNAM